MLKTLEDLKASGLSGDALTRFYAAGELTLGELADFVAKFPEYRESHVLVDGKRCCLCAMAAGDGVELSLLSQESYLSLAGLK